MKDKILSSIGEVVLNESQIDSKKFKDALDTALKDYIDAHGDSRELYVDNNDIVAIERSDTFVKNVFDNDVMSPQEAFDDYIIDSFDEARTEMYYDIAYEIIDDIAVLLDVQPNEIKEDQQLVNTVRDAVEENISIEEPFKYISQNVMVYLDVVSDEHIGFETLNVTDEDKYNIGDNKLITWLIESQGYTLEDFNSYIGGDKSKENKFFKSLLEELEEIGSHSDDQLVFLGNATLANTFEIIENKKCEIPQNATCGFVDFSDGSGTSLEIALEKPIKIDLEKDKFFVKPDKVFRYSVENIYGISYRAWEIAKISPVK